jgi:hypothetical protein
MSSRQVSCFGVTYPDDIVVLHVARLVTGKQRQDSHYECHDGQRKREEDGESHGGNGLYESFT